MRVRPPGPVVAAPHADPLEPVPETRHYLVAEQDGAVVGYAGLVCTGAQADVQTVAVAAGQQGRGLGGELLRALVAEARRRGA